MVNKSATEIGTLAFANGNRTTLWIGYNRNTGAAIVWNKMVGSKGRATRATGGNIAKLARELNKAVTQEGARWEDGRNNAALDALDAAATA